MYDRLWSWIQEPSLSNIPFDSAELGVGPRDPPTGRAAEDDYFFQRARQYLLTHRFACKELKTQ